MNYLNKKTDPINTYKKTSIDSVDSLSLKEKVFQIWVKTNYFTAKIICKKLNISYKTYGKTINTYLSLFRSQSRNASLQRAHGVSVHRKTFYCLEKLHLTKKLKVVALSSGWRQSKNKNGMLLYRTLKGSVSWYKGGLVLIYLKRNMPKARALELFWKAFSFLSKEKMNELSKLIYPFSRHNVFKIGTVLPRFDIHYFRSSHGLRILCDGSHKDSVEVEESMPVFFQPLIRVLDDFREVNKTTLDNSKMINKNILLLSKNTESHLKLVNSLILESKARRLVYEKHSNSVK